MKKDIEKYINDNIKAQTPPSLSKENIDRMIDSSSEEIEPVKSWKKRTAYRLAAAAAVLAVVLGAVSVYTALNKPKSIPLDKSGMLSVSPDKSYGEIYSRLKKMRDNFNADEYDVYGADGSIEESASEIFNGEINDYTQGGNSDANRFGTTNTQEENVDEGDIIKTDGENIYLADRNNNCVYIVNADGGKISKLSEIKLSGDVFVQEIYLKDGRLAVIYSEYDYSKQPAGGDARYNGQDIISFNGFCAAWVYSETKVNFYDVTDPKNAVLISDFSQSGEFVSSRLSDGRLYIVSDFCVDLSSKDYLKNGIPETTENGGKKRIPADKIFLVNDTDTPTYAVICAFDFAGAKKTDSSAIFGDPTNVYATENSFYLVETKYDSEKYDEYLNILKFEFTETGLKYIGSAKAQGSLNSNLSMSEYGGYFRIATTCAVTKQNGKTVSYIGETNKLYIFDSEMRQTGIIDGFAKDEQIRSARYIGNYAYIVTFRQTDPLFVINCSDPKNPKIESELKLPGFSRYLHPVGGGLLVGIGNDGDENNSDNNMKVSLFSVVDPQNPKELSSVRVGNKDDYVQSNVFYSYKAFVPLPNGEFAVPLSLNYSRNQMFIRYSVSDGAVLETARYELGGAATEIIGGTYIGNYFYIFSSEFIDGGTSGTVDWRSRITSFDMTKNVKSEEIEL